MTTDTTSTAPGQELVLTFAELEALLANTPAWPSVRGAMNTHPPADKQIALAGLATLLIRGLATFNPQKNQPDVAPSVTEVVARLGKATVAIGVTRAEIDEGTLSPILLCAHGATGDRAMIRVIGPGILALSPLINQGDIFDQAAVLTAALLEEHEGHDGAVMVKPQGKPALTVRKVANRWEVADSVPQGHAQFRQVSRDEALAAVRACARKSLA